MPFKKSLILLLICFFNLTLVAQKSDSLLREKNKRLQLEQAKFGTIFKVNPLNVLIGNIPFTSEFGAYAEFTTGRFQSIEIFGAYLGKSLLFNAISDSSQDYSGIRIGGYRIQFAYKLFLQGLFFKSTTAPSPAPLGLYIAPHISYASAKLDDKRNNTAIYYIGAEHLNMNILVGYQFEWSNGVFLDSYLGAGYKDNQWIIRNGAKTSPIDTEGLEFLLESNFKFNLGAKLGYSF